METEVVQKPISIRPSFHRKFNKSEVENKICKIVREELEGKLYESAHGGELSQRISRKIHDAVREMPCDWYKFIIHVVLGEKLGQGVKCAGGCLWDDDTDCLVSTSLNSESMFCVVTVFAVFCYHYK